MKCTRPYEIASAEFIARIHSDTLRVLEEIGVVFEDMDALQFMEANGCEVDFERKIVRIEPNLVESSL
ncbi:MAG: trimethylamine methyltransferase family protein, partial [Anaerolineales bacterium]